MTCAVVCTDKWCHVLAPMVLLLRLQGSKHAEQCSVEPFGHTISHWMVDGCPGLFNSGHVTKLLDGFSLKIRSLVGMKSLRESIVYNEAVEQCFSCGFRCLTPGGTGLGVPGEVISYHQHVLVTA